MTVKKVAELCVHGRFRPHGGCDCQTRIRQGQVEVGRWVESWEEYVPGAWVDCMHEPYCPGGTLLEGGDRGDHDAGAAMVE